MSVSTHPIALSRQLQGAATVLLAVRAGQSMTAALEACDAALRPGVQALAFHTLRQLGRAEALRSKLAQRPPPPEADALLCVALSLAYGGDAALATLPANAASPNTALLNTAPSYTDFTLVDQTVAAAKQSDATRHQASFINGCLRRFLRERAELVRQTDHLPQAQWNHPQWWIDRLRKDHPAHWQDILHANNTAAPLVLRVNARKTSQAQYLRALAAINIEASAMGPYGVVLAEAQPVPSLPGFAEGHFSVQDAAAQLAAPLLITGLAGEGDGAPLRILDACAAPGGKTAHLLELSDCEVTALDIDARRTERIAQNLARLGLQAHITTGDASQPAAWWDGQLFDGVLLDAPCTASGIVRRHPDVRWLRRPTDIAQLAAIQMRLIEALWLLVKPGGRLLYCTCSVFRDEGDNQIQTFVAHHKDASLMPSPGHLRPQSGGRTTAIPDNLNGEHDGFYYALVQKNSA
jgi:16S rRNA (cytosine967-C5)-methyltransferase